MHHEPDQPALIEPTIRFMHAADIDAGLRLCRVSGWNQLRHDWELFLQLSPQGCWVAAVGAQVIGTVTTINYENRFSWVAMVLVDPAWRGRGIGTALLQQALQALQAMPAVRLDATPAGEQVYRHLAFVGEVSLRRLVLNRVPAALVGALAAPRTTVRPVCENDWPAIAQLDRLTFGATRLELLRWLWAGAPQYAWVHDVAGQINGYVFGRHGHNAEHVGPVIAPNASIAQALLSANLLTLAQRDQPCLLDVTLHDEQWLTWLASLGFVEQRPFLRMVRGTHNDAGLCAHQFAIVGPEFG